jgi:hypothetical protein
MVDVAVGPGMAAAYPESRPPSQSRHVTCPAPSAGRQLSPGPYPPAPVKKPPSPDRDTRHARP